MITDLCISFSDVFLLLQMEGLLANAFSVSSLCSLMRVPRVRLHRMTTVSPSSSNGLKKIADSNRNVTRRKR